MLSLIHICMKSPAPALSLPGAPDGEYVVIQYETQFEHHTPAETDVYKRQRVYSSGDDQVKRGRISPVYCARELTDADA